jgi:hypothetical protein
MFPLPHSQLFSFWAETIGYAKFWVQKLIKFPLF